MEAAAEAEAAAEVEGSDESERGLSVRACVRVHLVSASERAWAMESELSWG